jgi:short-subunit dehydrogenase
MNIVITGATKGIGRAIALKFAEKGFNLALCSRTRSDLDALSRELLAKHPGIEIIYHPVDMSSKQEVLAFAAKVKSYWSSLDVLVNNAGVFLPGEIQNEADGVLEKMIDTNLYSAYYLTRALLPIMSANKNGHIFNMCSVASQIAYPNGGSYSISKFALYGFSKVLREELKNQGIKVTAVLPGATWTASWEESGVSPEWMMQAADIAESVWGAFNLGANAVVEEILLRPQLGDI